MARLVRVTEAPRFRAVHFATGLFLLRLAALSIRPTEQRALACVGMRIIGVGRPRHTVGARVIGVFIVARNRRLVLRHDQGTREDQGQRERQH